MSTFASNAKEIWTKGETIISHENHDTSEIIAPKPIKWEDYEFPDRWRFRKASPPPQESQDLQQIWNIQMGTSSSFLEDKKTKINVLYIASPFRQPEYTYSDVEHNTNVLSIPEKFCDR